MKKVTILLTINKKIKYIHQKHNTIIIKLIIKKIIKKHENIIIIRIVIISNG